MRRHRLLFSHSRAMDPNAWPAGPTLAPKPRLLQTDDTGSHETDFQRRQMRAFREFGTVRAAEGSRRHTVRGIKLGPAPDDHPRPCGGSVPTIVPAGTREPPFASQLPQRDKEKPLGKYATY